MVKVLFFVKSFYSDGNVICGSVDGQRLWGKEISTDAISNLTWSADSNLILFSIGVANIDVYKCNGDRLNKLR